MSEHVIALPEDKPEVRAFLEKKLEEYKGRLNPYKPIEAQARTMCKIWLVGELLSKGQVETFSFARNLAEEHGDCFSNNQYDEACGVIEDYILTGGKNVTQYK